MFTFPPQYHHNPFSQCFPCLAPCAVPKMFWVQYRWTRLHVLVLASSIFAFFLSAFLVSSDLV